jgi:hypothetical protein
MGGGGGMKSVVKTLYGKVVLLRSFCPWCKAMAILRDGRYLCCDRPVTLPEKVELKRMCEPDFKHRSLINSRIKKEILEEQNNKCIYCRLDFDKPIWNRKRLRYEKVRIEYDQFDAWIRSGDTRKNNMFAACRECNAIKGSRYFPTIDEARVWILNERGVVDEAEKMVAGSEGM